MVNPRCQMSELQLELQLYGLRFGPEIPPYVLEDILELFTGDGIVYERQLQDDDGSTLVHCQFPSQARYLMIRMMCGGSITWVLP